MKILKTAFVIFIFTLCVINLTACSNSVKNTYSQSKTVSSSLSTTQINFNEVNSQKNESSLQNSAYSNKVLVINNTQKIFESLCISPERQCDWEEMLLPGFDDATKSAVIVFNTNKNYQYWDIKTVDDQGNEFVWEKIELFKISEIILSVNDLVPEAIWK